MMEVSMMTMNWAAAITARPHHRRDVGGVLTLDMRVSPSRRGPLVDGSEVEKYHRGV
jgi:hypothetical protein